MADNQVRFRAVMEDRVSARLRDIGGSFDKLTGTNGSASLFGNVGAKAVAKGFDLIGDAAYGALQFVGDSIKAASDLNEANSKSRAVFGDLAEGIEVWGKSSDRNFGLSKRAALEAAATYGNLFQAFGIGQPKAAAMSKTLVELAADLASFNNTSMEDAIQALRSGLSGETEPLKRYGVALNDVRLKEEALRLGLIKTTSGVLPVAIKSQAAYSLILKDTSIAQGDFERTSEGAANQQRILSAELENTQAVLGEKLVPAQLAVLDGLIKLTQTAALFAGELPESRQETLELANALLGIAETVSPFKGAMGSMAQATEDALERVERSTKNIVDAVELRQGEMGIAAEELAAPLPLELDEARRSAVRIARRTPGDIAEALRSKRQDWRDALDDLKSDAEGALSRTAEIAKLKGVLSSTRLAEGLLSKDPVVRAAAAALQRTATTRLAELEGAASTVGDKAAADLAKAIKRGKGNTKDAAELHEIAVKNALGQLPSSAYGWGQGISRNYAKGIDAERDKIIAAARRAAAAVADYIEIRSPARMGPLSRGGGPGGWGQKLGESMAEGLAASSGAMARAASTLAGAGIPGIPSGPSAALGGGAMLAGGGAGGLAGVTLVYAPTYSSASPAEAQRFARDILGPVLREAGRQGYAVPRSIGVTS